MTVPPMKNGSFIQPMWRVLQDPGRLGWSAPNEYSCMTAFSHTELTAKPSTPSWSGRVMGLARLPKARVVQINMTAVSHTNMN